MLKPISNNLTPPWVNKGEILGNIPDEWLFAIISCCGFFAVSLLLRHFLVKHMQRRVDAGKAKISKVIAEMLAEINTYILAILSVIFGAEMLNLPEHLSKVISHLLFIALALQVGLLGHRIVAIWKRDHLAKRAGANSVMATLVTSFLYAVVWIVVVLAVLENDGINITTLVASLGIGGVALALAVQTILGDLFAAISIAVDKPFQVGDSITAGDTTGTVERIGLKSTHIRSVNGELVVCSNMDLLKRTIQNFERMSERRVVFGFDLHYRTALDIAEKIPETVRSIVESQENTRFARAHLRKLARSSMEFEVVYYVLNADYKNYMDIQQTINLSILKQLAELSVDIALPDGNRATLFSTAVDKERRLSLQPDRRVHH